MEKQKEQLRQLLERLGYAGEDAAGIVEAFMEADSEIGLPIDSILLKAQEYARPILRSTLKREFSHEYKGQYMGEAINKIVAASKGKIRRANYEDGNVERALQDLVSAVTQEAANSSEGTATINELRQQLEALAAEKEQAITELRGEFAAKENSRMVYDTLFAKLGNIQNQGAGMPGKKLSVDQAHAARTILRELEDEYLLKYDEEARDVLLYDRVKPEERVHDGQKFVAVNELIEKALSRNNWIAQSNGGSVSPRQLLNRPQQGPVKVQSEGSEFRKKLEAQMGVTP